MEMVTAALHKILLDHAGRYPAIQVQDVYKLLHQAALGSGHAIRDEQSARDWLEHELAEMGDGPNEPLMDPLLPDGRIVRVHLHPYARAGKDPEILLQAFIRTANKWRGSPDKLKAYGQSAKQLADEGLLSFSGEAVQSFFATMESQGFPAVHHSETYASLYRPAYRVVARQFLEEK